MKARAGFTLIEMLLTLGVLALGLTVLFSLLPAAAGKSRENRDIQRIGVFADDVFASLAWSFEQPSEATAPTLEDTWTLLSAAGPQMLLESEDEILFPNVGVDGDILSPFRYTLILSTNDVSQVDAVLRVRSNSLNEPLEFTRRFTREQRPW
jgi:prepilin-type N-terminal cleavage/methylation domain-containing protein